MIQLTDQQQAEIEAWAHKRGYQNAAEYVLALVEADKGADDVLRRELKEGLRQALRGETVPLESLWE